MGILTFVLKVAPVVSIKSATRLLQPIDGTLAKITFSIDLNKLTVGKNKLAITAGRIFTDCYLRSRAGEVSIKRPLTAPTTPQLWYLSLTMAAGRIFA